MQLPDRDDVLRHFKRSQLFEDDTISAAAFKLRPDRDEYVSVFWLQYFGCNDEASDLDAVQADCEKVLTLKRNSRLGRLPVGDSARHVAAGTKDSRTLRFIHKPSRAKSHSGIFDTWEDEELVAELLTECVTQILSPVE